MIDMEQENQEVLLSLLNLRNNNLKNLKDKVYKSTTFTATLFMIFIGWIVESKAQYSIMNSVFLTISVFGIWISNYIAIRTFRSAIKKNRWVLIRIEQCLSLYENGFYHSDGKSLYPNHWQNEIIVEKNTIFRLLMIIPAVVATICIWINYFYSN